MLIYLLGRQRFADTGYLNDRVSLGRGEAVLGSAFNVERHNSEGRYLCPRTFQFESLYGRLAAVYFYLTETFLEVLPEGILMGFDSEPPHASDVFVGHEAQGEGDVAFKGLIGKVDPADSGLVLKQFAERSHYVGRTGVYFEVPHAVFFFFRYVAVDVDPLDWLEPQNGLFHKHLFVKVLFGVFRLFQLFEQCVDCQSKLL